MKYLQIRKSNNIKRFSPKPVVRESIQKKESSVARLLVSSGGGPIYSDKDYENFSKETYLKNVIGFRCILEIAQACSFVDWELHKKLENGQTEFLANHELNDLLTRPNQKQSWNMLMYRAAAFLVMSGNSFFEKVQLQTRKVKFPSEMYVLRPDRIKQVPGTNGKIKQFEYSTAQGKTCFDIDQITGDCDLLHIGLFHPTNDFWGSGAVEVASREIDCSNETTDWNMSLIRNQGRPGMVFSLVGDITDEQFEAIELQIDEKFSGSSNAGRSMVITGDSGTKAEPYSFSPAEMEFIEGNRELSRRIALAFGVPPMLLGIPGDNTYSNMREARQALYEGTTTFYLNMICSELNNWLFKPEDKLELKYDMENLPALEPRRESKWKRAQDAQFLTVNEKRELAGYEMVKGGDIILVPMGMQTLDMIGMEINTDVQDQAKSVSVTDEEYQLIMGLREKWDH